MNTVNYKDYEDEKAKFFKAHDYDYTVHTSDLQNNSYHKEYAFEDGATFYESTRKVEEVQIIEVHKIKTKVVVAYMVTEYWSSDDSTTKVFYENW